MADHRVNWDAGAPGGDHLTPEEFRFPGRHSRTAVSGRLLSGREKPWENHNVRASSYNPHINLLTRPHFKRSATFQ